MEKIWPGGAKDWGRAPSGSRECQEEEEESDSAEEKCIFKKRPDEGTIAQNVTQDAVQILPQRKRVNFQKARELARVSKPRITPGNGDSLLGWAVPKPPEASSATAPKGLVPTSDGELLGATRSQPTRPNMETVESPTTVAISRKWPTLSPQDRDSNGATVRGAGKKGTLLSPSKNRGQVTLSSDEELGKAQVEHLSTPLPNQSVLDSH